MAVKHRAGGVAFCGRSNVGKSSLVNALTGQNALARVSHTPGRTRQLNFFDLGGRVWLVDLPGYGFAQVSKSMKDAWKDLATAYLEKSSYSPVQHDLRKPKEKMLLERIRSSRAEAAIITAAKMCEPGLDEQVAYVHALDEAGIPYFVSEFEEKMTSFDQFQLQLETFVENVLFA